MLSAIIVDDEPIVVEVIRKILAQNLLELNIVGHATDLDDAKNLIIKYCPDILLLDVEVGNRKSFELVKDLNYPHEKIFLSSNREYAYNAFMYNAAGFILKPVNKHELITTVAAAMAKIKNNFPVPEHAEGQRSFKDFIAVSSLDSYEIIKLNELMCCTAEGKYTHFRLKNGRKILSSRHLGAYSNLLEHNRSFFRVSRSHIINFDFVVRVIKKDGLQCELSDGTIVSVSRRKTLEFNNYIRLEEC
jgi:two-component system, LytTR family, response regulator